MKNKFNKKEYNEKYFGERPWLKAFYNARRRCSGGKYKEKGIKFNMTKEDFENIWARDNAVNMKCPSIDRIDSNGDYVLDNCRFIEVSENRLQGISGRKVSNETRRKLSENNGMLGKHHTKETREKMSKTRKGVRKTEEHKRKISETMRGDHVL